MSGRQLSASTLITKEEQENSLNKEDMNKISGRQLSASTFITKEENSFDIDEFDLPKFKKVNVIKKESIYSIETTDPLETNNIEITEESLKSTKKIVSEQKEEPEYKPEYKMNLCKIIFLSIIYGLGYFDLGYNLGVFNSLQENLNFDLKWKKEDKNMYLATISSMIPVGAIIGSIIQGKMAAIMGRRLTFIILNVISIVGLALTMIANTIPIIIGRLITGIAIGGYQMLVPVIIFEYIPPKYLGVASGITNLASNLGTITAFGLGINVPPSDRPDFVWWRIVFAFSSIFVIFSLIILLTVFKYDTPIYLLKKNNREGCKEALKVVYKDEKEIESIIQLMESEEKEKEEEVTYKDIFCNPKYTKLLFMTMLVSLTFEATGIDALNSYSSLLFLKTMNTRMATIFTALMAVSNFAGSIISIFVFGKISNRKILLFGLSIIFSILLSISLLEYYGIVEPQKYLLLFYSLMIGSSIFMVFKILPELLPEKGVAFGGVFMMGVALIQIYSFPYMISSILQVEWTFLIWALLTLFCLILVAIFYKETHGLNLSKVQELYSTWM